MTTEIAGLVAVIATGTAGLIVRAVGEHAKTVAKFAPPCPGCVMGARPVTGGSQPWQQQLAQMSAATHTCRKKAKP